MKKITEMSKEELINKVYNSRSRNKNLHTIINTKNEQIRTYRKQVQKIRRDSIRLTEKLDYILKHPWGNVNNN